MARPTDWNDIIVGSLITTGTQGRNDLLLGLPAVDHRGATLIRTLLRLSFSSNTVAGVWGVM